MNKTLTIVERAIQELDNRLGIKAEYHFPDEQQAKSKLDGEIHFQVGNQQIKVTIEVKQEFRMSTFLQHIFYANSQTIFMIVAEKIYDDVKEKCRREGIGYLDTGGDIYLNQGGIILLAEGGKPKPVDEPKGANRAFTKAGLRAVFHLLINPDLINAAYRTFAEQTQSSLSNVRPIIDGLREGGYILRVSDNEELLINKKQLMERWLRGYQDLLQPSLYLGSYDFIDRGRDWTQLPAVPGTAWTGEAAYELMNSNLDAANLSAYTEDRTAVVKTWKLVPKKNGKLKLYKKFWKTPVEGRQDVAPELLVYADLVTQRDPRLQEAAKELYHNYLEQSVTQ